ncbi:MAG: type II secretion system protein, partial [Planctomycetota bacterium]
ESNPYGVGTASRESLASHRSSGMTLLEISAAAAILTMSLAGIGLLIVSMRRSREETEARTAMLHAAQSVLERAMGLDPASLEGDVSAGGAESSGIVLTTQELESGLLEVSASGSWELPGGGEDSLQLVTHVYVPES